MRLFLSGGGSGQKSIELDRKFALAVGKTKPVLYIPIAIDKKKHPYPDCLKWINITFNPIGLDKIEPGLFRRFASDYAFSTQGSVLYVCKDLF